MERRLDHYLERLVSPDSMTFYKALCDFANERIEPNYLEWERNHQLLPQDIIDEMGQMGLFGVTVSEEYGGQGGCQLDLILLGLALGYHSQRNFRYEAVMKQLVYFEKNPKTSKKTTEWPCKVFLNSDVLFM